MTNEHSSTRLAVLRGDILPVLKRWGDSTAAVLVILLSLPAVHGQGITPDESGHALLNGHSILACWNFQAGAGIPEDFSRYQEFQPFLHGWDFRINLPHIQFQLARASAGAPAMVGVEEGGDITPYGHVNNSIWIFQTDPSGVISAKILPSRRDLNGSTTENVSSLVAGWFPVGTGSHAAFVSEKPAAVVIGTGLGVARIYLVARDPSGALYMTAHTVTGTETPPIEPPVAVAAAVVPSPVLDAAWADPWTPLGISSLVGPAVSEAFGGQLALSWIDAAGGDLRVQLYNPATETWGPSTSVSAAAAQSPQLVWQPARTSQPIAAIEPGAGPALNLFFVGSHTPVLEHAFAVSGNPLAFQSSGDVSSLVAVFADQFDAMAFNRRLHVVIRQDNGQDPGPVFYTTSLTGPGGPATWSIPSDTGISTSTAPRVAWMYENILAIGAATDGRVRYARLDPNRPGNAQTGAAFADHWLDPGQDLDPTMPGSFSRLETLTYNSDVYLSAGKSDAGGQPAGLYIVNCSRAVLKQLMTQKWGIQLIWGGPGGSPLMKKGEFAAATEIPALGDVDGDGETDLVKFSQAANADGPAPAYWYKNFDGAMSSARLLAANFSPAGEIPMVGDFDGDGKADLISFAQHPQFRSILPPINPVEPPLAVAAVAPILIGEAPVWVLRSSGVQAAPIVWQTDFSPAGEVPFVGDFNGDGKDDIISFSQQPLSNFDGGPVSPAVVWVALSDGAKFGEKSLWHTDFSPQGEIPMAGDFDGDGRDDIISFARKGQFNPDGSLLGIAPVRVALSDGTKFGTSNVWHTFFSQASEIPQVADFNMDGRDDVITFLAGTDARTSYVAYSLGDRFDRSSVWHSDFITSQQVRQGPAKRVYSPQIGHLSRRTLADWTGLAADSRKHVPDIFAFSSDASVQTATTMGNVPYAAGAPWERYKFFTDKGIGVALFPEWIFQGPGHCTSANHRLAIQGLAGSGGDNLTITSVRYGGRAPHILEELGHSIFANCFHSNTDKLGLSASIFDVPPEQGGIGANALPGCPDPNGFLSCRPDSPGEHYFLQLFSRYRMNPEFFRRRIAEEADPTAKAHLSEQYQWLKQHWYDGQEFATSPVQNASLEQPGVPFLPETPLTALAEPTAGNTGSPPAACGAGTTGATCGAGSQLVLLLTLMRIRYRRKSRPSA